MRLRRKTSTWRGRQINWKETSISLNRIIWRAMRICRRASSWKGRYFCMRSFWKQVSIWGGRPVDGDSSSLWGPGKKRTGLSYSQTADDQSYSPHWQPHGSFLINLLMTSVAVPPSPEPTKQTGRPDGPREASVHKKQNQANRTHPLISIFSFSCCTSNTCAWWMFQKPYTSKKKKAKAKISLIQGLPRWSTG